MRFGRTSGHNIMRFGRAGHNIMHFGKRDSAGPSGASPSQEAAALAAALPLAYAAGYGPSQGSGVLPVAGSSEPEGESAGLDYQQLYVDRRSSFGPRLLTPHLFLSRLSSLYTPYRRFNYNYNKKADNRDNVFMHFG